MGRRRKPPQFMSAGLLQEANASPDNGYLTIGGLRVVSAPLGRGMQQQQQHHHHQQQQRWQAPPLGRGLQHPQRRARQRADGVQPGNSSEDGSLDEELQDYLDNMDQSEEEDEEGVEGGDSAGRPNPSQGMRGFAALQLNGALEGPLAQDLAPADGKTGSNGSSDSGSDSTGSDDTSTSNDSDAEGGGQGTAAEQQQYPVQVRNQRQQRRQQQQQKGPVSAAATAAAAAAAHVARLSGIPQAQLLASCPPAVTPSFKSRAGVKGAQNGKLAPGEKRRLKEEAKRVRRAQREARRGFDVVQLLQKLEQFVAFDMDMLTMDKMGSYGQEAARAMASCFGLSVTVSQSKRVTLHRTDRMALPTAAAAAEQLMKVLTQQLMRVGPQPGAAAGRGGDGGSSRSKGGNSSSSKVQGAKGREPTGGPQRLGRQGSRRGGPAGLQFQQPVSFISGGWQDPNQAQPTTAAAAATVVIVRPAAAAAAAEPGELGSRTDQEDADTGSAPDVAAATAGLGFTAAATAAPTATAAGNTGGGLLPGMRVVGAFAAAAPTTAHSPAGELEQALEEGPGTALEQQVPPSDHSRGVGHQEMLCTQLWRNTLKDGSPSSSSRSDPGSPQAPAYNPLPVVLGARGLGYTGDEQELVERPGLGWGGGGGGGWVGLGYAGTPRLGLGAGGLGWVGSSSRREQEDEQQEEEEQQYRSAPAAGRTGRQTAAAQQQQQQQQQQQRQEDLPSEQHKGGSSTTPACMPSPSAFGMTDRKLKEASRKLRKEQRRADRRQQRAAGSSRAAAQGEFERSEPEGATDEEEAAGLGAIGGRGYAAWESHGTGAGSRLMRKMGWQEGMGLGRDKQGRRDPLQAAMRPARLGLGA